MALDGYHLWIHDGADLADFITTTVGELTEANAVGGEVRQYGGRRRIVTTDEEELEAPLAAALLTYDDYEWLKARRGRLLMVRDPAGRLIWGTTFGLDAEFFPDRVACEFTVVESTHSAAV